MVRIKSCRVVKVCVGLLIPGATQSVRAGKHADNSHMLSYRRRIICEHAFAVRPYFSKPHQKAGIAGCFTRGTHSFMPLNTKLVMSTFYVC